MARRYLCCCPSVFSQALLTSGGVDDKWMKVKILDRWIWLEMVVAFAVKPMALTTTTSFFRSCNPRKIQATFSISDLSSTALFWMVYQGGTASTFTALSGRDVLPCHYCKDFVPLRPLDSSMMAMAGHGLIAESWSTLDLLFLAVLPGRWSKMTVSL